MPLSPHFSVSATRPMGQDLDRPSTGASSSDTPDHSIHARSRSAAHTQSPKRLSVFSGRSRSNTTISTPSVSSSRRSPSSMAFNEHAPVPPPHEDRPVPPAVPRHDRHESVSKSLFLRGSRILRRQGSKVNMVGTPEEEEDMEREKPRFDFGRRKSRTSDSHEQRKRLISDPFDFHHLTHTSPAQFQALGKTRENDLVTEFSAIRASQKPVSNLKGIRAEDIQGRSLSSEDLAQSIAEYDTVGPLPVSPPRSPGARSTSPRQLEYRPLRESRVFENFSRPVSRHPRGTDATASPPRAASPRLASSPEIPEPSPRVIDEILGLDQQQPNPELVYFADDDSVNTSPLTSPIKESSAQPNCHAITTGPGTQSIDARTMSVLGSPTSDLEDVPEENEATHWHDSPESQRSECPAALDDQISPKTTVAPPKHLSVNVAKELSRKFSEALGSPTLPQNYVDRSATPNDHQGAQTALRRQSSVHQKTIHESIYESWDDDIDYCYEHAAESNSDFDWARTSLDESRKSGIAVTLTTPNSVASSAQAPRFSRKLGYLSTSALSTPDLEPSPSLSAPSSGLAITPSSAGYEGDADSQKNGSPFQPVSSSVLSGALTKHIAPDALYEDYLAADGESDRHFSFYSQGGIHAVDQPVSPRSSFSPISKYNSQESLILSRAASIVRKHRSSVSTTSVPELVHSLASSRDFSSSDLMLSGEQSDLARANSSHSSHHRQTKSLARELETQIMSRPDGNGSTESNKFMGAIPHDRAKSTSEVEAAPLVSKAVKPELPPRSIHRKKSRTPSYSLFPSPPLPSSANP